MILPYQRISPVLFALFFSHVTTATLLHHKTKITQRYAFPALTNIGERGLIRDELEAVHITQARLAHSIGVSPSLLNEIIRGKRGVNAEMALLIEAALGVPAELLLNLQREYNVQIAKSDASFMRRLSSIRKISAVL